MTKQERKAYIYSIIVAIGGFIFGLDAALISGTINFIVAEFGLSDLQLGTAVSAPGLGVLIALPFLGFACNMWGRKKTLQVIASLYLLSAICSALAPSFITLVAARFLGGLAFSSITLASMYIGEIAPPQSRGKLVSMIQINIVVGLSAAYFLNYLILQLAQGEIGWVQWLGIDQHTWRWMLGTEILPALIWFILLFYVPKSPAWLLFKGRETEAISVLSKLVAAEDVDREIKLKKESLAKAGSDRSFRIQLKEIFSKPMRLTFVIAFTIAVAQQATGINAILFYAPTIFEQLGVGTDAAFAQAIWIGLISVVFTFLSILLIDRIGRRPLIIGGMIWIVLSLVLCAYSFKSARYTLSEKTLEALADIPEVDRLRPLLDQEFNSDVAFKEALSQAVGVTTIRENSSVILQHSVQLNAGLIFFGILSFIAAFQFSLGPIMWVLFSEIFPISLRGVAIPFFALVTSLVNYLVQQFFPWQLATMGAASIFLFYASIVSIGLIILFRTLPETKNLSIEEIQDKLVT